MKIVGLLLSLALFPGSAATIYDVRFGKLQTGEWGDRQAKPWRGLADLGGRVE